MKNTRLKKIESFLKEKETSTVQELCEVFNVSVNTIRRDIAELTEKGTVNKFYGGVSYNKTKYSTYENRSTQNKSIKDRISELAAKNIKEDEIIYIDSGTTTANILTHLDSNIRLTVITNSLDIITHASKMPNVELYIIGYKYRSISRSFIGTLDNNKVLNFNINKAFMSVSGISISEGLTNSDYSETEIKHSICNIANEIFVLADSTKINKSALLTYCDLEGIDAIFTDKNSDTNFNNFCEKHNIKILICD
ncbi:DeoR/GlpR family DNA-binding transcription regulator [Maledivibacter halophilus]|uniref:Transcriptional regulator, DeoR family n=1 Tax=Maledivibacter halophilus TaxID=36842 RepID=A0A1T5M8I7_9FIRM|nr:DeoR/GlpR family DNA-binding transcription regulator [Maledivibacter halophilus]SKC84562.1 transcriptional regulator, DeoR family [Maledivibacter halophilus]